VGALLGALPVGEDSPVGVVAERVDAGEVADCMQQGGERFWVGGAASGLVEGGLQVGEQPGELGVGAAGAPAHALGLDAEEELVGVLRVPTCFHWGKGSSSRRW
jgi:hypothetical protein